MERTLIHVIVLGCIFGLTKGAGVLPDGLTAAVGGNAMFKTTVKPTATPFNSIIWQFKGSIIVVSNPTSTSPSQGYEDRVTVDPFTGSLELKNVSVNDNGIYNVAILPQTGAAQSGQTTLTVEVPVSNVEITTNSTDLIEFDSVRLSCSSSGSSPSFHWFNVSSEVTDSDRVQITDGGSTMTMISVTQYDQGPFHCVVSNLVSNETSDLVKFNISYGPYNVKISGPTNLHKGNNLELKCTAESVPPASYSWKIDGKIILTNSDVFSKQKVETSATYTCVANNSVTGKMASEDLTVHVYTTEPPFYIIGIVFGCLLVVGVCVGVACFCKKKKRKNKARRSTDEE